jgi:metal-responsive CopG/Arc/MetJ family transcriptional regulator
MPDELLEKFDDTIWELQVEGELDRDANRSQIVRELVREWIDEQQEVLDEGNLNKALQTAD